MPFVYSSIPDQSGKVAVVTGANGGLGLEVARSLAGAGAHVVMAARNQPKASSALASILTSHPDASLEIVELDLGSLASVSGAAHQISEAHDKIDILVNNAGVMALPEGRTTDGFETQFGVNHLGHWAFTAQLLVPLLAAPAARVVAQTSAARLFTLSIDMEDPHLRQSYCPWVAYYQSKLANYIFSLGLQERFDQAGATATSLAAHPGLTNSDLQATTQDHGAGGPIGWLAHKAGQWTGMSTASGALPVLRAATDPSAEGGALYGPLFTSFGSAVRRPVIRPRWSLEAADLWELSARETGLDIQIPSATDAT